MVPDVIVVDVDLIKDFCEQVEGTNIVESLREGYVITDEELDEIIDEINLWSVIDFYEEKIDDLKELSELSESQQKELYEYNEKLKELLKKVKQ